MDLGKEYSHDQNDLLNMQYQCYEGSCTSPTWRGYLRTTLDALIVLEACMQGRLSLVSRRPRSTEKPSIAASGNVFIYEERSSGIKRWTDGVHWSPSRIMGRFLVYRELSESFPGGKRKASKREHGIQDAKEACDRSLCRGTQSCSSLSKFQLPKLT